MAKKSARRKVHRIPRKKTSQLKILLAPFLVLAGIMFLLSFTLIPKNSVTSNIASEKNDVSNSDDVSADLVMSDFKSNVPQQYVGKPVNVRFTLTNDGKSPARALYSYSSQADGYSTLASDNTCGNSVILNSGESCISSYDFTFPKAGVKTMTVVLDSNNQIQELNEANNTQTIKITIVDPQISAVPTIGKSCPATLKNVQFSAPCKSFTTVGATSLTFTCSDGYSNTVSAKSCQPASYWNAIATQSCAQRKVACN